MCDLSPMTPYIADLRKQTVAPSPATATAAPPLPRGDGNPLCHAVVGDLHPSIITRSTRQPTPQEREDAWPHGTYRAKAQAERDAVMRCDPLHGRPFRRKPVAGCPQPEQDTDDVTLATSDVNLYHS